MSVIFICGVSLGACNSPVVAGALKGHREVDGIFGFQASIYGAGGKRQQVPSNVKFAHLIRSDNPIPLPGLGAQHWAAEAPSTHLVETTVNDPHPGDGNTASQDLFLADMKRLMRPGEKAYLWGMYGMLGAAADPVAFLSFLRRVAGEGIHIMRSPYRDFQTQLIVDEIMQLK